MTELEEHEEYKKFIKNKLEYFVKNNPHLKDEIDIDEFKNVNSVIEEVRHLSIFLEEDATVRADVYEAADSIASWFNVEKNEDAKILYENMKDGWVYFTYEFLQHFENLGFDVYHKITLENKIDEKAKSLNFSQDEKKKLAV